MEAIAGLSVTAIVAISIGAFYKVCETAIRIKNHYEKKKRDKQLKSMDEKLEELVAVVRADNRDLDTRINELFEELKANPSDTDKQQRLIALLNDKRTEVMNSIEAGSIEEFVAKSETVAREFAEMIKTIKEASETAVEVVRAVETVAKANGCCRGTQVPH